MPLPPTPDSWKTPVGWDTGSAKLKEDVSKNHQLCLPCLSPICPLLTLPSTCTWSQPHHRPPGSRQSPPAHNPPTPQSVLSSKPQGAHEPEPGAHSPLPTALLGSHLAQGQSPRLSCGPEGSARSAPSPPCPPLVCPLAHSAAITQASSLFLQHSRHDAAPGPLHVLCPLPGRLCVHI